MSFTEIVHFVVAFGFSVLVALAAISDVRRRRIPNWTVLAIIGLFVGLAFFDGGRGAVSALAAAGLAFLVSAALYAFKIVGAGDSKLFTAVALFAGLGYLPLLVLATSLTGGAIALVSLMSRPQRALAMVTLRGKGNWGRGVPYGLAIALGGAVIVWAPISGLVRPIGARPDVTARDLQTELQAPHPGAR